MTACNNNVRGGKASRVITAALVATLSVGTPMAAIASTVSEGGVDILAVDPDSALSKAKVKLEEDTFEYDGDPVKPVVSKVTLENGEEVAVNSEDYKIYTTKADKSGKPTGDAIDAIEAGEYCLVIEAVDGDYAPGIAYTTFKITSQSLSGAVAYYNGDTDVTSDQTYNAEPVDIAFKLDGAKLVEGKDYTVKYYAYNEDWSNPSKGSSTAPTDAGKYYARLTGLGQYAGSSVNVDFEIYKLDLSTLTADDFYVPTVYGTSALPTAAETVKGSTELAKKFTITLNETTPGASGKYTYSPALADKDDPNFTGVMDFKGAYITSYKVSTEVGFSYDGESMPESMTFITDDDEAFDIDKVKATYVDDSGKTVKVEGNETDLETAAEGKWSVKVTDAKGNSKSLADLSKAGSYILTFEATPDADFKFGGTCQVKVTVVDSAIDCNESLYVMYNGKVVNSIDATYDSSVNFAQILKANDSVKLVDADGNPIATDWSIEFYNADGEQVSTVTDAGKYTMKVVSDTYQLSNNTFNITINKADICGVRIATDDDAPYDPSKLQPVNGQYALAYTGKAITPTLEYTLGERDTNGNLIWKTWDLGAIANIKYSFNGETVDNIKDLGEYTLTVTAKNSKSDNYQVTADAYKFAVAESLDFLDVPSDSYYYDAIMTAVKDNGYMSGYSSKFFGPDDQITRAQAAIVFYNMAGEKISTADGDYSELKGWKTGFSDVDGKAYYAEAIAWAEKTGIVTGYGDTGTFGPEDNITREQFAIMLSRYAQLSGNYDAVDTEAVLAKYADGDAVSDYAADAVAWAADNGYIGNGSDLMPSDSIIRGQVAIIAVRYQPAKLA